MSCGYPYCGGSGPDCACTNPKTAPASTKLQSLICRYGDCRASGDTYNATVHSYAACKAINDVYDALQGLIDGIHAGRFMPNSPASEGYCNSLVKTGESALASLPA